MSSHRVLYATVVTLILTQSEVEATGRLWTKEVYDWLRFLQDPFGCCENRLKEARVKARARLLFRCYLPVNVWLYKMCHLQVDIALWHLAWLGKEGLCLKRNMRLLPADTGPHQHAWLITRIQAGFQTLLGPSTRGPCVVHKPHNYSLQPSSKRLVRGCCSNPGRDGDSLDEGGSRVEGRKWSRDMLRKS